MAHSPLSIPPALDQVPFAVGRPSAQAIVARYGRFMPVLMPVTIAVTFVTGFALDGTASLLLIMAAVVLVAMLAITFIGLMPLNALQLGATDDTPQEEWRSWRVRWLRLHSIRVVCDVAAIVLVAVAAAIR